MARQGVLQTQFPRLEADGVTHRQDCECVRCEAGYRPSERERALAAHRWSETRARQAASKMMARRQERRRARAISMALAFAAEEGRTAAALQEQARLRARLEQDVRLDELLRLRASGMSAAEAVAEVERRLGPSGPQRLGPLRAR